MPSENLKSLVKIINKKLSVLSTIHRTRFLCCCLSVADSETVSALCGGKGFDATHYLKTAGYVAELESLYLPFTVDMFTKSSKLELIKKILIDHGRNSKVLVVCVKMCMEYGIWYPQVWEVVLQRMTEISMTEELEAVLEAPLGDIAHVWHSKAFLNAWNYHISALFKKKGSVKALDETDLFRISNALLRCPCLMKMDLSSVTEKLKYSDLLSPQCIESLKSTTDPSAFVLTLQAYIRNRKMEAKDAL